MRILLCISLLWLAGLAPVQSQAPDPEPNMDWELIDHSTFTWPGIDHMACATDSLANVVCAELRWTDLGSLGSYLTIVYNEALGAEHSRRKLPVLVYPSGRVEDLNKLIEWERFLGNTIIPKYNDGTRVTWQTQLSTFRGFTTEIELDAPIFSQLVRLNDSVDILSYLDDGREIVSTLSLEGLPPLMDELVAEAREAAPDNASWAEDPKVREEMNDIVRRFDRKYGITEEDMEETGQKREERLQALREKVQRLKQQQQQDSGGN